MESSSIIRNDEGQILCRCGQVAKKLTSGPNAKNPNKPFFVCPKSREEQCKFFLWEENALKCTERKVGSNICCWCNEECVLVHLNEQSVWICARKLPHTVCRFWQIHNEVFNFEQMKRTIEEVEPKRISNVTTLLPPPPKKSCIEKVLDPQFIVTNPHVLQILEKSKISNELCIEKGSSEAKTKLPNVHSLHTIHSNVLYARGKFANSFNSKQEDKFDEQACERKNSADIENILRYYSEADVRNEDLKVEIIQSHVSRFIQAICSIYENDKAVFGYKVNSVEDALLRHAPLQIYYLDEKGQLPNDDHSFTVYVVPKEKWYCFKLPPALPKLITSNGLLTHKVPTKNQGFVFLETHGAAINDSGWIDGGNATSTHVAFELPPYQITDKNVMWTNAFLVIRRSALQDFVRSPTIMKRREGPRKDYNTILNSLFIDTPQSIEKKLQDAKNIYSSGYVCHNESGFDQQILVSYEELCNLDCAPPIELDINLVHKNLLVNPVIQSGMSQLTHRNVMFLRGTNIQRNIKLHSLDISPQEYANCVALVPQQIPISQKVVQQIRKTCPPIQFVLEEEKEELTTEELNKISLDYFNKK